MAKKKLIPLRGESAQVRSSGGEVINVESEPIRPNTFLQDSFDMAPRRRTVEDLAAKVAAGNQKRQNSPAASPANTQDWRPSYMRQQAQPIIPQPQTTVPSQNRQATTTGGASGSSPATMTQQGGAVRQSGGRTGEPKMPSIGRFGAGNIDLFNRPQYRQPDGSLSTVNSISIGTDDGEVLIPTIGRDAQGRPVQWTDDEAIEQYNRTGQHLGKFKTVEEANRYADQLHRQQEVYYGSDIGKTDPASMQRLMGIRGGIDRSGGVNQTIGNAKGDVEILQGEPKNLTREGQWAARHPYAGTAMYGVANVVGSGEGVFNTAEAALRALATGEKMDPNAMKAAPLAQAYRTGSAEGFRRGLQEGITAPVAKAIGIDSDDGRYSRGEQTMDFLSGVVADRVSSLMNMGIAGGLAAKTSALTPAQMATIGTASGALMGANAANQSLYETSTDEDTTARESLALGITSGIWEALFEAYSTESFLSNASPTSIKDLILKTAAQMGVEFQEEAATEGANIISDYLIRGDNSDIGKDVAAFKANNPDADPNQVARNALQSAVNQIVMAGVGGALSGAMGGGVIALNQFRGGSQLRSGIRNGDVSLQDIARAADTSTPQGQRVYELANELAMREAEGRRAGAMGYGALNNAIINDIEANGETPYEAADSRQINSRESAIDRTNRIREALRGDNAQAAWETPEDTGVHDVVLPSDMREQAAYDLLENRNAGRISWDTEQGAVTLDREADGSYTFTNERGESITMDSDQAADLIPAGQTITVQSGEEIGDTTAPTTESVSPTTTETASSTTSGNMLNSTPDAGTGGIAEEIAARQRQNAANRERQRQIEEGFVSPSTVSGNTVAISQQSASGNQYVAQTANERLEQAARQVTRRRTVEKAAQLRAVYEARKNNSPNLRSVVNGATMLSQAEVTRALDMGARDAVVATSAQEEISNGRQEGEGLSGQRGVGILPQRTGKRTGRVSAETEAVRRIWRSGEAPADSGAEVLRFTERRRASEVIPESSEDSFVYIPANKTELMEQGEAEANSFGLNVVSWAGGEAVSNKGNYFRGATVPGSDELYAQADNADFTQDKIIKHEIAENKLSKAEFEQIIEEAKEKSDFVKAAIEIYQSLSGEDEYRSAKELVCDSNGRMNQFERRAQENPDNAEYQVIREILQRAIDTINPIVSEKLETKKVRRTAGATNNVSSKNSAQGKANSVNNSTEHSVELPYTFGSKAAKAWVEKLDPEAKKYADLFIALHEIGLKNQAEVWITSQGVKKLERRDIAAKNMLVSEWNNYIDSNKEFAEAAKKLAEAVPEDIRKNADISPDGRIKPTEFDERLKLMRSFMQRIVDSLPGGLSGNKTLVNGKEVTISRHSKIPSIGGEAYRKALLEERRRQYREGTLGKVVISGLSGDKWGAMGFLATNTKTIGSGDFTTFCPQMYFGNGGCWYCYRLSALRSGTNNKLVGQNVWYTGEILRLRQQDIDNLNSTGGLRIQSFGDWMEKYTPQLLDLLVDAETVGLQIKIITKEPSMIDAVALLKEQGYGKNLYFNLSADYTIEEQKGPYQPNAARPSMVGGDGVGKEGKTYWKRALSVEEANEYRKKYPWVNIRTVATNIDEFINSLESPYVQVVTGYHGRDFAMKKDENGNMTGGYERISSETGDTLVEVESLGDNGMPVFDYSPEQNKWVRIRDGKNKKQKALADAIEDRGLQFAYYIKACCQTGRCKDCKGNCGAVARDFAVKNATNKDQESIKYWDKIRKTIAEAKGETYKDDFPLLLKMAKAAGAEMKDQDSVAPEKFWQKRMRAITSDEYGETAKYQFPQLLKQSEFDITQKRQEQRQAIFQAGLDGDEDYEDVIAKAYLVPMDERYRILQDGMRAAAGDKGHVEHSVRLPEGLSNYQRRNLEFNKNETTVGNPLKTVAGTTIKRYGWTKKSPDGVGKQLSYSNKKNDEKGSQIYLHKNYAYDVVPKNVYDKALELLKQERPDFKFNTIMYLGTNKRQIVRFDEAPDFDTAREPIPGDMIAVNVTDGTVDTGHSDQIWHHKWLWVKNDYKGFDVKKSWEWSKLWLSVIRDTKNKGELIDGTKVRIDNKGIANGMGENGKWWNEQLRYFGLPIDGEDVDYDSRTRADKFVSNLKATQEQRANEPQTDTSEDTSLNQVPASMTNFRFNSDDVVLDWGGGRYDAARRFLESEYPGLKMYVYDPFNRTKAYNTAVLDQMKKQSASVVTINNVLNVINSEKAQRDVVSESKKYLKENGVAIFTIYQGDKSGIGEITKEKDDNGEEIGTSSWQNNLETAEYVPMIQDYYKHVKATGNFIIASDSESALKNVKKTKKDEKSGLVSRSKPFIEQKYDMKTAEGFDADSDIGPAEPGVQYSSKLGSGEIDMRSTTESEEDSLQKKINTSMTMDQAKQMVQRAFNIGDIKAWFDGEYKNGDEWLAGEGSRAVALVIDNDYSLQQKYINKVQGILDDEFTIEDVLDAYSNQSLTGAVKEKKSYDVDLSKSAGYKDNRFYAPKAPAVTAETLNTANLRATAANKDQVNKARLDILIAAHNDANIADKLGITKTELNKKLRTWSRYSARAMSLAEKLNNGVALENQWSGLQNCSIISQMNVTDDDINSMVKSITGTSRGNERNYIAKTILAADTHIDWSWLNFEFKAGRAVEDSANVRGLFSDDNIIIGGNGYMDTVAHEMGHALSCKWASDLMGTEPGHGVDLADHLYNVSYIKDPDAKRFAKHFEAFMDSLTDVNDIRSEYTNRPGEVFARFFAKFVEWTNKTAGNYFFSENEYYKDQFKPSQYTEFVKLLQEKAALDAKRAATETANQNSEKTGIQYSAKLDSAGNNLTEAQAEYFKDSKARDKDGNLLVLYHGTGSSGFTKFRIRPGHGVWLTTSKRDADSYAGNFEGKLFDPNEAKSKGQSVGGSVRIGKHLRFENKADMEQFLKENPDANEYLSDRELLDKRYALDDLDWDELDEAEDEYNRLKRINRSVGGAYERYEMTHSQNIPLSEMLDHPERYSLGDVKRAWYTYDRNANLDDEFDYSSDDEFKQVLIDGLKDVIEERAEENGQEWREDMLNMQVSARIPEGMSGEIATRTNRTYALYADVVKPYVFDIEGEGNEGNGRFYHTIEKAMADPQYDGVIVENARVGRYQELGTVVLVKDANQVKLTSNQNPTENEDIRYSSKLNSPDYAPTFYSKLQREIQNFKGEKIGAASVESYLKGKGVKDEEIKWSGIRTYLEGKKSVNKQDLMQYLRDNEMQIEEKILGGDVDQNVWSNGYNTVYTDRYYDPVSNAEFKGEDDFRKEAVKRAAEDRIQEKDIIFNISDDYMSAETEDGEVILEAMLPDVYELRDAEYEPSNGTRWEDYKLDGGKNYREVLFSIPGSDYSNQAMQTHWKGDKGVLAHARVQDFDSADGGKVLFVEEIQSDWHNAAQKATTLNQSHIKKAKAASGKDLYYLIDNKTGNEITRATQNEIETNNVEDIHSYLIEKNSAPDAPFRSNYTDYVLKNLLRMAAEGNYDYLAWTTAEMQMDRWNPERLPTSKMTGSGSNDDVAFEEGYRIEYDQQIPKFLKKYGKQWGAGLQNVKIYGGWDWAGNAPYVPAIVVNDAMKESVLTEGQPMYSRSLTAGMSTQDLDNRINDLVKKYGALPKGEKPARNVDVPMQTSDNKNTRRFVRTILESGITSAGLDDSIKSAIINESLSYEVATDKDAAEYAASVIRIGGVERAQREWDKARRSDTFNKDHMALGQFLLKEYAKNNDIDNAMNMIQDLAAEGTRMGQNIQAMRMLKKYAQQVPAIGLGYIQKTVDQMNREAKAKMGKRYKEMKIAPNLAAEYIRAQTRDEIDAALGKIYKNLGSQVQKTVPEEIIDHLRTWRYMSMLGNPRTHIRNLVGNALFVPAVTLKNAIGTGLEGASKSATKTKSLTVSKQAMEFAKQDAIEMKDVLSGESEKSIRDLIMDQRKVYKFEPLNKASKGNSAALEAEDWVFLRWHYQNALAQYITANNLDTTVQNPAWLGRARRYAVQEAQKATYRDANKVSAWLNQSKGAGAVVKYMMEGLMPFKKTPTNILRRGVEYSPAGLVRTMSKGVYDLNHGKMSVNEWIDNLSSGLSGTAIFALGMFLASTGAILGGYKDDDDKELRKLKGLQEYSVQIGDKTYTIDWAAPGSLPLFVGVETMYALRNERGMNLDDMTTAAMRLIDPMINMSMLSGLNDTLDAISYADHKLSAATMEMFYSLLGQYVPTLLGQAARTIDTTQRINYQDMNTGKPKDMLYFMEKVQNKIPFMTFRNDPYLNEFGQENTVPRWTAALQNFVSPGYISEIKDDHVLDEIERLNEAQDKENVLPRKMKKYIGSGDDRIDLTSSEYYTFQKTAGQTAYNILDVMIDDKRYDSMNANQQATAIKVAYDYAKAVGRIAIQPEYKEDLDGKVKKVYEDVQSGMQAYDSILNRIRTDNVSEGIKPDLDENGNAIDNSAKYKTIDKILGTSMSKAEKARTFETAYPSKSLDAWKASGGDVYDYMMGTKLQQDVSKLSEEKKKKTYEYVINNKNYTNYQKVAWLLQDSDKIKSKQYLAWKEAKGSDWDFIKSKSDLEKFQGLETNKRRAKVIGYIKRQTTNEEKMHALWQMADFQLDSKKNGETIVNGNFDKYFK